MSQFRKGPAEATTETDHHMLGVITTIWLLLQLPVGLALGRFIACSQKQPAVKRAEAARTPIPPRARAA